MDFIKNIPKLYTVDADALICTPLETVPFTVDELISHGLHMLAGDAKIGKSWLTLWMCLQVAKGEAVWKFPVRGGTVLYLCLEDSFQRIQSRLFEITDDAPRNLHFACMAQGIATGLPVQIETFLAEYPDTVLIAVDTLQKVRGIPCDNAGAYASDYHDLGILKSLADKHKLSILVIHHASKRPHEKGDPFKRISGTTGITGVLDGCMMMVKEDTFSDKATLAITGRDIESRMLTIRQNDRHIWQLESDTVGKELQKKIAPPVVGAVCDFVATSGSWHGTATELSRLLEPAIGEQIAPNALASKINQFHELLKEQGIAYRPKRTATEKTISLELIETHTGKGYESTTCRGQAS